MRVLFFWEPVGGLTLEYRCNPYAGLLARALEKRGIHLELGAYAFERDWLEQKRPECEVLHLNWLHHFYRRGDLETTQAQYTHFEENLNFARSLGYRIVWTLHNLYPHERPFPQVDHLARLLVCRLADTVVAHCHHAARLAGEHFCRTDGLQVIPHGHFIDVYPNQVSRLEARQRLEIPPAAFVYLFFGNARVYKGIDKLVDAFCRVAAADAQLVLMMRQAFDPGYADALQHAAAHDERIRVFTSPYFPNEEFQFYLNSADVAVLPFAAVLTSGSAIAALSFGKPVIVPNLGCLPELVDDSMGLLYDPQDEEGLEKALVEIRRKDLPAAGHAALQRARDLDWDHIAGRLATVYRGEI